MEGPSKKCDAREQRTLSLHWVKKSIHSMNSSYCNACHCFKHFSMQWRFALTRCMVAKCASICLQNGTRPSGWQPQKAWAGEQVNAPCHSAYGSNVCCSGRTVQQLLLEGGCAPAFQQGCLKVRLFLAKPAVWQGTVPSGWALQLACYGWPPSAAASRAAVLCARITRKRRWARGCLEPGLSSRQACHEVVGG